MLVGLVGLHAVLALAALPLARRAGRGVFVVCAAAPAAAVAWAFSQARGVLGGGAVEQTLSWVPALGLEAGFRLDAFGLLMVTLVSGVGVLIFAYSAFYFSPRPDLGRFAAALTAFAGAMLGLVLADNLLLLYVFWELTSITSYLLIGFDDTKGSARAAALQAILITVGGGLAMLGGFILLGQAAGTYSLSQIIAAPPAAGTISIAMGLILVGAFTKSAQAPFHMWLPAAMVAPTPVSAYLHSATMVKGGVYLVARLAPAFAFLVPLWRPTVVAVGVATMILGGVRALRQHDLKLLLAFGTISQLGLMIVLLGVGRPEATAAGAVLLLAHGAFKATLFMVTGIIDRQAGTRDLRGLSGLGRRLPGLFTISAIAAASMAGLPPLLGFVAKESAYEALLHGAPDAVGLAALAGIATGSVLTFAYSARWLWGAFAEKPALASRSVSASSIDRPATWFALPAALLAVVTIALGIAPEPLSPFTAGAAQALDPRVEATVLHLWHGWSPALLLSAAAVVLGLSLTAARERIDRAFDRLPQIPGSHEAYRASLRGLNAVADRVTGTVQSGSLPVYVGIILLTFIALPTPALLGAGALRAPAAVAENPEQLVVALGILVAGAGLLRARRRFAAVLFLGAVGYGVALMFVVQGAPDLALTQLLIETLGLVIFVLVLRHLPEHFTPREWALGETLRRTVAVAVGLFVFGFALVAGSVQRPGPPVSEAFLAQSLTEAGGRNVVNVVLIDFRGIDTLGEITVLAVAALGVAGLVRASRRRMPEHDEAGAALKTEERAAP